MLYLCTLLLIYSGLTFAQDERDVYCLAPGEAFLNGRFIENFGLDQAEDELKEIVSDQRNYEARERIKSIRRQIMFGTRLQKQEAKLNLSSEFQNILDVTGRGESISNFPMNGLSSIVTSPEGESLQIQTSNLPVNKLDFFPAPILQKLGTSVKIRYLYPYDKFEYFLTSYGEELPFREAVYKMQSMFEDICERNALNNHMDRKKRRSLIYGGDGASSQ